MKQKILFTRFFQVPRSFHFWLRLTLLLAIPCSTPRAAAQAMAHRGWTGAGGAAEPWWHRAVFYRIDPARFQASGAADTGDLAGIALRLDYLQSLGVDALVLVPAQPTNTPPGSNPALSFDPDALENLIREASRHNLRVVPTLSPALEHGDHALLLQTVHEWLAEGAAGIAIPELPSNGSPAADTRASLIDLLIGILHTTPGDRVLLTGPANLSALPSSGLIGPSGSASRPRTRTAHPGNRSGRLTVSAILPANPAASADLHPALVTLTEGSGDRPLYPLLRLGNSTSPAAPTRNAVPAAAVLLASQAAALFDFGAEIGLDTAPAGNNPVPALMQWTPANVQQAPIERPIERPGAAPAPPAPGQPTPFGAYKPFVRPPPRSLIGNPPAGPSVALDRDLPPPPSDPNTLLGFTAGPLPVEPVDGETLNVATQERDPRSVLNAFRALIALHAGDPALRAGTQTLLHPGTGQAVVFLRRPPPGARTSGSVIVAVNLGDTPLVLSLDAELATLHLHPGPLRALFSYGAQMLTGESTATLRLPPHAVFLGDLRTR